MNEIEIEKLAKKIKKRAQKKEEEMTGEESLICAVIISEIMKEKLDYPLLFKKVRENRRIQYEFSDDEFKDAVFSSMLGKLMIIKLVDGERKEKEILNGPFLVLTEEGIEFMQ